MKTDGLISSLRWPEQLEKLPPCQGSCPSGNDIRGWIATITQPGKPDRDRAAVWTSAWRRLVASNPFPATMGRICPAPCEAHCNRNHKDGAVVIHALERFIGDWALQERPGLPLLSPVSRGESIGVIGAGPAGLSFAYQMARRGYQICIYERAPEPGGMLHYGIPKYRLPRDILTAEIQRILDLGIDLQLNTGIGRELSLAGLKERHSHIFLGIGAQQGRQLRIQGEEGPGVWTGIDYLHRLNSGQRVDPGKHTVVIGGGNSAINAARAARRAGSEVTLLYRRTREEMPAIAREVEDARLEAVNMEFLAAPVAILRQGSHIRAVVVQRMALTEPDQSGRRRPVPRPGTEYELQTDSVITAISQEPEWATLGDFMHRGLWLETDGDGRVDQRLWAGGDMLGPGIASLAIGQGRRAAEALHAQLRGLAAAHEPPGAPVTERQIKPEFYAEKSPVQTPELPSQEWLMTPEREICQTLTPAQFGEELGRCFSCGLCFGCQQCWMYCNPSSYTRLPAPRPGAYFSLDLDSCEGCGKCIEVCPCGFLSLGRPGSTPNP